MGYEFFGMVGGLPDMFLGVSSDLKSLSKVGQLKTHTKRSN